MWSSTANHRQWNVSLSSSNFVSVSVSDMSFTVIRKVGIIRFLSQFACMLLTRSGHGCGHGRAADEHVYLASVDHGGMGRSVRVF